MSVLALNSAVDLDAPTLERSIARDRSWLSLSILILLITLFNAIKPLHMDDAAFYPNAIQSAHHAADPYGFTAFWAQWPEPGNWTMAPPVLPYWWAIAITLFGNSPVLWKLWLLPIVAMFVVSLHRLLKRFAPGMELPLVWMVALSPAFFPALNLMLDIPAIALGLAAVCVGLRAVDQNSKSLSIAAGLIAALAIETKYTAAIFPPVVFVYALLNRRVLLGFLTGLVSLALCAAWESYVAHRYGMSHFLFHLNLDDSIKGRQSKAILWTSLPILLGALAPVLGLLGLAALGMSATGIAIGGVCVAAGFSAMWSEMTIIPFFIFGLSVLAIALMVARKLPVRTNRDDAFVVIWLIMELIAFEEISPFAAARRTMGLIIILTILFGRLASMRELHIQKPRLVRSILIASALLGTAYATLDFVDARANKNALDHVDEVIAANRQSGQTVWYTGHWGTQFYAGLAGYLPIEPEHSQIKKGDWIVLAHFPTNRQEVTIPSEHVGETREVIADDAVPLTCVPFYYGSGIPVRKRSWPRAAFTVCQATDDFIPASAMTPQFIADWAINRHRPVPESSLIAMHHAAEFVDPATRRKLEQAISEK